MKRDLIVKKMLADALEYLIQTKSIDDITVNDIINQAEISRTTFYRYFKDKFDLMYWSFGECIDELADSYHGAATYRLLLIKLFSFFKEKSPFFSQIMNYRTRVTYVSFYWYFLDRMVPLLIEFLQKDMQEGELTAEDTYMIHYHCNGILRTVFLWLKAGTPESPEKLADIVLEIVSGKHPAYALPFFQEIQQGHMEHGC